MRILVRTLVCLAAVALHPSAAAAQQSGALADSLLRAADSIRSLGQRSSADSAILRIRRAIAIAPNARAHAMMASAFAQVYSLRRTDRWAHDSALAHADAAVALDPRNALALYARAVTVGAAGDAPARLAGFERVLAADSTFAPAVGLLITAYADAGRVREAIALGERMRQLQPRNYQAQFRLGWEYGYLWDQGNAVRVFEHLANDTASGIYRSWGRGELAYLARARGDFTAAVRHMEGAAHAVPDDLVSRLGLAMMLLTSGDAARARPLIESGLARDSNATGYGSLSGRLLLAWAARDLKDSTLAKRMFADAERRFAATSAAGNNQNSQLLKALSLQGRIADAVELLRRMPPDRLYGGPDDHDGTLVALRGEPEFESYMAKRRARVNAERRSVGLAEVVPH